MDRSKQIRKARRLGLQLGVHVLLIFWLLYSVTPFAWTLLNSVKIGRDGYSPTPKVIPSTFTDTEPERTNYVFEPGEENYAELWLNTTTDDFVPVGMALLVLLGAIIVVGLNANRLPVPKLATVGAILAAILVASELVPRYVDMAEFYDYFLNSIIVTVATVVVSISIGCLAGYALARYSGIGGIVILFTALAFRSLPRMTFVLPYYYLARQTGLYDTRILLIATLVSVNQPFTIWMLRSFFMEIPREIEEAAMIDGCGRLQAFVRVIIPIMWPGIITTALFTLLLAYNEFLLPRLLMQENLTLPAAIARYTSGEDVRYLGLAAAGSVSITLPIIIVIIFFQKYLVKGLAFGAVKG